MIGIALNKWDGWLVRTVLLGTEDLWKELD